MHIARGLYYSSFKSPRVLLWSIGVIILVLMMAFKKKAKFDLIKFIINLGLFNSAIKFSCTINCLNLLPFNRARTRALLRVGPHNQEVLTVLICGLLGDWWADEIKNQISPSVRFNIEQGITNSAYIHSLNIFFFKLGYCSNITPKLVKKSEGPTDKRLDTSVTRFNYRLTLFTFTSFHWIYTGFYHKVDGVTVKKVPEWIGDFITPLGLAHLVMQIGSLKDEGLILNTKIDNINDLYIVKNVLKNKYDIDCTIISHFSEADLRKVLCIKVENLPLLQSIIKPYILPSFSYLLQTNFSSKDTNVLYNNNIIAVAKYDNADIQKELVIKQNRDKSGIYRWICKETGKSYVGSSVNLSKRFNQYYNYNHIADPKRNMLIYRALLKYGYSMHSLEILEYCDKSSLIQREQYYLDLLKPEYNILLKAG